MYNISMGTRTFIVVFCTTLILFSLLYFISDLMYLEGYKELEQQYVEESLNRISEALSANLESLDIICYDWASWDDTYEYAKNQNSDFIDTNMGDETFINMDINLMNILDPTGNTVYQRAFDLINLKEIDISQELQHYISKGTLIHHSSTEKSISGIILLPEFPMLIVSRPILTSHDEGPSTGTLIIGRFLNSSIVDALSNTTHQSLSILPLNYAGFPTELETAINSLDKTKSTFVEIQGSNSIVGYLIVKDVDGNPAFVFQTDMPRSIFSEGQKTMAYLHISLLFISVVFFFVFVFAVNRTILTRMTVLSDSVNRIGQAGNMSKRVSISGKDELSSLAKNINVMLDSLEKSGTEIRTQKEFISRILANTPNAVLAINKSLRIMLANSAFNTMFNLGADNLEGKEIHKVPTLEKLSNEIKKFIEGKSANARIETEYKGSGIKKILIVSFTRMEEEEQYLIVLTDVTSERERQAQLYLADRLVSIGEMASGIAHELNNPLTSIIGLSELLTEEDLQENIKEDLVTVNSEAQRAADIVQKMLSFARKRDSIKQPVQLNKVVEDVLTIRAHDRLTKNIIVDCKLDPHLPEVIADYFQIQQVFLNLILNAEQAMSEAHGRGTLTITSEKIDKIIRISFSDDGPGIDQQNLNHIFDPFFTTKEVGTGTGLGLSICYGIVTAHKGQIYAQSEIGKGATFVIEFPVNITS